MISPDEQAWPREQVAAAIRARIASGDYGPRLPTHEQLAAEYGVAPKTILHALAILKAEGLIEAVRGRGTFVRR